MKLLLFDSRYNNLEKLIESSFTPCHQQELPVFFWGIWQCNEEVTFLLYEDDVKLFPEGSLIISPQQWKVIKLGGRNVEFEETGIVSAMSRMDEYGQENVSTLNISTANTNCTLVPEEFLELSLTSLKNTFQCPIKIMTR